MAVLGGAGPLGELIYDYLTMAGHEVKRYSRTTSDPEMKFDVLMNEDFGRLANPDAVIYLAWDTKNRTQAVQQAHSEAAIRWSNEASRRGIRFLFASTTLAMSGASSTYAREKFRAESGVVAANGKIARIGLICDDSFPFLATRLRKSLGGKFFMQVLLGTPVFPVSGRQVGLAFENMLQASDSSHYMWLAEETPISLGRVRDRRSGDSRISSKGLPALCVSTLVKRAPKFAAVDRLAGLIDGPSVIDQRFTMNPAIGLGSWDECLSPE